MTAGGFESADDAYRYHWGCLRRAKDEGAGVYRSELMEVTV